MQVCVIYFNSKKERNILTRLTTLHISKMLKSTTKSLLTVKK